MGEERRVFHAETCLCLTEVISTEDAGTYVIKKSRLARQTKQFHQMIKAQAQLFDIHHTSGQISLLSVEVRRRTVDGFTFIPTMN